MNKNIFILFFIISFSSIICAKNIEIISDVTGNGIEIKNHYKVHVNYRGTLEDGTEFDSSYKRKMPLVFQIGLRQVIQGWEKGIMGMKVGGKRTIKIPPELAYGSTGAGDLVPPNATLIFELDIVNAFKPGYSIIKSKDLMNKQKEGFLIIDIRTDKERKNTGVIKNSIEFTAFNLNGNFNPNFLKNYQQIVTKNDHVVFVSNEGEISSILANGFVEQLGSKNMYSLLGGIQNWIKEGRELLN
tara:strand:- start:122 stop:850 length:729 start_codon:yes stop_codon:yes gene_type:complete